MSNPVVWYDPVSRFAFTDHAIERFSQRHAPNTELSEVRVLLHRLGHDAVRLKEKSVRGQTLWRINYEGWDVLLVTKRDPGEQHEIVVTVLPPFDDPPALELSTNGLFDDPSEFPALVEMPEKEAQAHLGVLAELGAKVAAAESPSLSKGTVVHLQHENATLKTTLKTVRDELAKVREKWARHEAVLTDNGRKKTIALRVAVKALLRDGWEQDPIAQKAVAEIAAIDSGFVSTDFLAPVRKKGA